MRRHEREITERDELEAVLHRATVVHLAMVDGASPYVVPLNFGYADGCLYLHGAYDGRKMAVLRRNATVGFSMLCDETIVPAAGRTGCNFTSRYRSIVGEGRVEIIDGAVAKRKALDVILRHYAAGPFEYDDGQVEKTCVFCVVITWMTGKKANV